MLEQCPGDGTYVTVTGGVEVARSRELGGSQALEVLEVRG
jgi:hypothetical protein